jgi:DNA-directed RNA polymerase subunit RPC12/RpoP
MGRDVRCPHCGETFMVGGTAAAIHCAACGKEVPLGPESSAARAVAVAPAPKVPVLDLKKVCPSCGERFEGKLRDCPKCGASYRVAKAEQAEDREVDLAGHGLERKGIRKGVMGGLIMIVIAVVWFGLGWAAGRIFFYPPILFLIGLFAVVKGLVTGNYAGENAAARRGRR